MKEHVIQPFFTAIQFLTRIPVPDGNVPSEPKMLKKSVAFFPAIGTLLGICTATVFLLGQYFWNIWLAAAVAVAFDLLLTGAFHEDAVADYFDAFGGGWTEDDILRILKDSRIGSYGAAAMFMALLIRIISIASIEGRCNQLAAITASAAISRLMVVISMRLLEPIENRESLAKDIGRKTNAGDILLSTVLTIPVIIFWGWLMPVKLLVSFALVFITVLFILNKIFKSIRGITGDCLGTICYTTQIIILVVSASK